MKKISFISFMAGSRWGGSEELWYKVALAALEKGYEVCTLTQKWNDVPDKINELQTKGAVSFFYGWASLKLADKIGFKLGLKQYEYVPKIKGDFFIISNGSTYDFLNNRKIVNQILESGKPYILISQHSFETGHPVPESCREFAIRVIMNAKKFYFVSERNLRIAERQLSYTISNAEVISNPLNIKEIGVRSFPASETLLMACVARLDCDFKGQDALLEALNVNWKNYDFKLTFYGSGPHKYYIEQLINFYNLQDKVSIEGHVNNVDEIWLKNQVLVLPSISEGTSLALVEANMSGRCALGTDVGDSTKYIKHEKTGFVAANASLQALSDSLKVLWDNKHRIIQLGEAAFLNAVNITDLHPEINILNFIKSTSDIT